MPAVRAPLRDARGGPLLGATWTPPAARRGAPPPPPAAVLVFHHGLAEHAGRYDEGERMRRDEGTQTAAPEMRAHPVPSLSPPSSVFDAFAAAGIEVRSYDALNHGANPNLAAAPGDRAYIPSFSFLVDDLRLALAAAAEAHPTTPLVVGGHSLGGLVALHAAMGTYTTPGAPTPPLPPLAGLLLSSAAIDVDWTPILRAQAPIGGLLARLAPRARLVPGVPIDCLSPDPALVAAYVADPLTLPGNVRTRTANETLKAFRAAAATLAERGGLKSPPVFAIHGDADRCTSMPAAKRVVEGAADGGMVVFEGGYHELFHGATRARATRVCVDWILGRAGAQSKM